MIKRETKWQTVFNTYLREKQMYGFFELKVTTLDYFPFAKIEKGQYDGLQSTEKHGLVWKMSDADPRPKPCDCLSVPPLPSYLVIKFKDGFYLIRFSDIVKMRDAGAITIARPVAEQVAEKIIKVDK
jgi:hypothetical protein